MLWTSSVLECFTSVYIYLYEYHLIHLIFDLIQNIETYITIGL